MSNQTLGVPAMLFGFLRHRVSLPQFEAWVYATDELEQTIGFERDERLLGFDYRQPKAQELLDEWLLEICERCWPAEHKREVARRHLCGLVAGTEDIFAACYWLAER